MPATVPTMDDFQALEARVSALEAHPPEPQPPGEGVQAKRICELVEAFGVNTFSSMDEHNVWGSWPADYRPEQVISALKWMTGDSDFAFRIREYHFAGREAAQSPWLRAVCSAIPGTRVALCVGANGQTRDVATMVALAADPAHGVAWLEGLNEPNEDFGSGTVPLATTVGIQDALWTSNSGKWIMGPSIVAGMPHPEGWVRGYCGDQMGAINAMLRYGNGHYYPPGCPDIAGSGTSIGEYIDGLNIAYGSQTHITEFHPTLFNHAGAAPGQPGWNGDRDAYYTLLSLFRCGKIGDDTGLWWYALFDYGQTYICGLFPKNASDPRRAAYALRNLCAAARDRGPTMRNFAPGRLAVTVTGLAASNWDLYQASDGRFFIPLWRAGAEPGGATIDVTVALGKSATVIDHDLLTGNSRSVVDASVVVGLGNEARLLVVT